MEKNVILMLKLLYRLDTILLTLLKIFDMAIMVTEIIDTISPEKGDNLCKQPKIVRRRRRRRRKVENGRWGFRFSKWGKAMMLLTIGQ